MTPHMTYLVCLGVVADSPWMITQRRDIDGEKELLIIWRWHHPIFRKPEKPAKILEQIRKSGNVVKYITNTPTYSFPSTSHTLLESMRKDISDEQKEKEGLKIRNLQKHPTSITRFTRRSYITVFEMETCGTDLVRCQFSQMTASASYPSSKSWWHFFWKGQTDLSGKITRKNSQDVTKAEEEDHPKASARGEQRL